MGTAKNEQSPVIAAFTSYPVSIAEALDTLGVAEILARQQRVMIKPNLITNLPPPITTPPACCDALVAYVRRCCEAEVIIAEGCGSPGHETDFVFDQLGYTELAKRLGVRLVDLNNEETELVRNKACRVFPEFHLPRIASAYYIINVPVLKAHSIATITGSLKNMMGFVVPRYYQTGGHWKKSAFHRRMHDAILDLNRYRTPDLTVMDASVGMAEYHLGGAHCEPPANRIIAGYDAQEVDRAAAELLGLDWRRIPHLARSLDGES